MHPYADQLFIYFIATVIIIRIWLFIWPVPGPTMRRFRIHHYHVGLVLLGVGAVSGSLHAYAIGLGLFADECAFIILRGKTHADNYSTLSLAGTLGIVIGVFLLREVLVRPLL